MINREAIIDYLKRERKFEGIKRELKVTHMRNKITTIVGPRRAGKTYFLLYLLGRSGGGSLYLNFESLFLRDINAEDFFDVLKLYTELKGREPKKLFLDEIQEVKGWESLLRTLLDYGYQVTVTGSSSRLLSREIATQLRGRSISYLLLPFSFREFLSARGFRIDTYLGFEEKGKLMNLLNEYLQFGGFPEVVLARRKFEKEKLLKTYFDEIFLKDFVERYKIRSIDLGRFLFEYIFQNFSRELSVRKVVNFLSQKVSLSRKTVYSYLENLEGTLSVFFVGKYSPSVYHRKAWPRKVYLADSSLSLPIRFSQDTGKTMENTVFVELLRESNIHPLMEIYYYRDYRGREVDFVLKERSKVKELIQVTYASGKDDMDNREVRSLADAGKLLGCRKLTLITWDYEDSINSYGRKIRCIPIWKWLLGISGG